MKKSEDSNYLLV